MRKLTITLFLTIGFLQPKEAQAQFPVVDFGNNLLRDTMQAMEAVAQFVIEHGDEIYKWTKKALTFVNQSIRSYTLYSETKANIVEVVQLLDGTATLIGQHPEFGLAELRILNKMRRRTLDLGVQLFHAFFDGEKEVRMDDGGTMETLEYVAREIRKYRRMTRLFARQLERVVSRKIKYKSDYGIISKLFNYN